MAWRDAECRIKLGWWLRLPLQSLVGTLLELEYVPVSSLTAAEGMLAEFTDILRGLLAAQGQPGFT